MTSNMTHVGSSRCVCCDGKVAYCHACLLIESTEFCLYNINIIYISRFRNNVFTVNVPKGYIIFRKEGSAQVTSLKFR